MSSETKRVETRRETVLDFYGRDRGGETLEDVPVHSAAYLELPALHIRGDGEDAQFDRRNVEQTVAHVAAQNDCTDFGLNALVPMLYRHGKDGNGVLPDELESSRGGGPVERLLVQ